jgi:hypothetical protein
MRTLERFLIKLIQRDLDRTSHEGVVDMARCSACGGKIVIILDNYFSEHIVECPRCGSYIRALCGTDAIIISREGIVKDSEELKNYRIEQAVSGTLSRKTKILLAIAKQH